MEYLATEVGFLIPICEVADSVNTRRVPPGCSPCFPPRARLAEVPLNLLFALSF